MQLIPGNGRHICLEGIAERAAVVVLVAHVEPDLELMGEAVPAIDRHREAPLEAVQAARAIPNGAASGDVLDLPGRVAAVTPLVDAGDLRHDLSQWVCSGFS